MSRRAALVSCIVIAWAASFVSTSVAPAADPPAAKGKPVEADDLYKAPQAAARVAAEQPAAETKIRKELGQPTEMDFTESPLREVVDYLKDLHHIEIHIDNRALQDAGIDLDQPVTLKVNNLPLKSALNLLLGDLALTYVIRDGVLQITTEEAAEEMIELHVYDASGIVTSSAQVKELVEMLRSILGEGVSVYAFHNLLVVGASQHNHEVLVRLLEQLKGRVVVDTPPKADVR